MPVADPDFELRRGPGYILLAHQAFLPSIISSFFTQNKEGPGPPVPLPWIHHCQCIKKSVSTYITQMFDLVLLYDQVCWEWMTPYMEGGAGFEKIVMLFLYFDRKYVDENPLRGQHTLKWTKKFV